MLFSRFGGANNLIWPCTHKGVFTSKSCYNKLIEVSLSQASSYQTMEGSMKCSSSIKDLEFSLEDIPRYSSYLFKSFFM